MGGANQQSLQDFKMIIEICKNHYACVGCPIYDTNGLHTQNSVVLCHKVLEKIMKEQNNNVK